MKNSSRPTSVLVRTKAPFHSRTLLLLLTIASLSGFAGLGSGGSVPPPPPLVHAVVTGNYLDMNGVTSVPIGMFGVHATPLDPAKIADWGIEAVRVIEPAPSTQPAVAGEGSHANWRGISEIVECFYDRYQPALVLTDPNYATHLQQLGQEYGESARKRGNAPRDRILE